MAEAAEPLEMQLVAALLAADAPQARLLATRLHERGFNVALLDQALVAHPHLEDQLWALMRDVIPLSRRESKRRAIRAAEERDWGDWEQGKRDK